MTARPRKDLRWEDIQIIYDAKEQRPLDLEPMTAVRGSLVTGDYSAAGWEDVIALERKELGDFVSCCTGENRERFERELHRMLAYPVRGVFIEASWRDIRSGNYRSRVHPKAVEASIHAWRADGIPICLEGSREGVAAAVKGTIFYAVKSGFRRNQAQLERAFGERLMVKPVEATAAPEVKAAASEQGGAG